MDDIGPLKTEKRGVKSIFCTIDSCTRMGDDCKFRDTFSRNVIKGIQQCIFQHGSIVRVVSDNSAYFSLEEWRQWCASKGIEHVFIALHRHESTGLIEKYQQKLVDRLRKMTLDQAGSWSDHLKEVVNLVNENVNQTIGFS